MATKVTFTRTTDPTSKTVVDGQILFDTSNKVIYLDNGDTRIKIGGSGGGGASEAIVTLAEYNALPPTKLYDDVTYYIKDAPSTANAINMIDRAINKNTVFNSDGSITETYTDGYSAVTTFDSDTQITEKYYKDDTLYQTKVTTFNDDGSITESYS